MKKTEEHSFGIIPLKKEGREWIVLLILHKGGKHWAFPKGHGNLGESPQETAIRELKEETGLEVEKFLMEAPLEEKYTFYRRNEFVSKKVTYFVALVGGTLSLQEEEIEGSKWVLLKNATQHLTFKEAKNMCLKLIKQMPQDV